MPYRPTQRTEAQRAATRERIVGAAHELIASGGYRAAQVQPHRPPRGRRDRHRLPPLPLQGRAVRRGLPARRAARGRGGRGGHRDRGVGVRARRGGRRHVRAPSAARPPARLGARRRAGRPGRRGRAARVPARLSRRVRRRAARRHRDRRAARSGRRADRRRARRRDRRGARRPALPRPPARPATTRSSPASSVSAGAPSPNRSPGGPAMSVTHPAAARAPRTRSATSHRRSPATTCFETDRRARRGARARGRGLGARRARRARRDCRRSRRCRRSASRPTRTRRVLHTHDRYGHRVDEVEFHPAWHELMELAVEHGCTRCPGATRSPGAHVARAALFMMLRQVEAGHGCPISMTYAAVPALRAQPELAAEWEPRLTSTSYDPRLHPAGEKAGALCGMAMTEKQGGSDVRANTTVAPPLNGGGPGPSTAAPATSGSARRRCATRSSCSRRPTAGVSCFLVPRVLPGRHAQPVPPPAAEGQARQPLQRVERGRVRRHAGRGWSASKGAACRRSSRWSTTRAWTACSARRPGCARASRRRSTTPRTARRSAHAGRPAADDATCSPTSRSSPRPRR